MQMPTPYHLEFDRMFDSVSFLEKEKNPALERMTKKIQEHLEQIKGLMDIKRGKKRKSFQSDDVGGAR